MKFEYLAIYTGGMALKQDDLNKLGADGWGLVTVGYDTAYLMREKVEAKEPVKKATEPKTETVTAVSGPFITVPKPKTTTSSSGGGSVVKHNPTGKPKAKK